MPCRMKLPAVVSLLAAGLACDAGRHTTAGFRLPPDGDSERGQAAFVQFGCSQCHRVVGANLPQPTVQPPVPVVLGGEVSNRFSDAYLVTKIVYPSYQLASYPRDQITAGGQSRMPHDYAARMTVRQLTDIVAFLQSRYTVRVMQPQYYFR